MQQPCEVSFGARVERSREFRGERRDVFEMRAERLPFPGGFGQAFALGVFGGVGVINHAQRGGGLRMIIARGWDIGRGTLEIVGKTRSRGERRGGRWAELRLIASVSQQYTGRTTGARHGARGRATANVSVYNLSVCRKNSGARVA